MGDRCFMNYRVGGIIPRDDLPKLAEGLGFRDVDDMLEHIDPDDGTIYWEAEEVNHANSRDEQKVCKEFTLFYRFENGAGYEYGGGFVCSNIVEKYEGELSEDGEVVVSVFGEFEAALARLIEARRWQKFDVPAFEVIE